MRAYVLSVQLCVHEFPCVLTLCVCVCFPGVFAFSHLSDVSDEEFWDVKKKHKNGGGKGKRASKASKKT
jgi:hypothetical protein